MYPGWCGVVCVYVCVTCGTRVQQVNMAVKIFFFARKSLGRMTYNKGQLRQVSKIYNWSNQRGVVWTTRLQ